MTCIKLTHLSLVYLPSCPDPDDYRDGNSYRDQVSQFAKLFSNDTLKPCFHFVQNAYNHLKICEICVFQQILSNFNFNCIIK